MRGAKAGRRGKAEFWYEDDQKLAVCASSGDRMARVERSRLISECLHDWSKTQSALPMTVLDLGCGDGVNLPLLCAWDGRESSSGVVLGLDRWPTRLERAAGQCAQLVQGDASSLPLATGSVDVVLFSHVLEHVDDEEGSLREILRVCRAGALVIVAVPNEGCLLARLRNHVLQRGILSSTDHVRFYTIRRLRRAALCAGLPEPSFVGREGFFFPHTRVTSFIRRFPVTARLERFMGKLVPSQAAGLVVAYHVPSS